MCNEKDWRPIPSTNFKYEASDQGEIRNVRTLHLIKTTPGKRGYPVFNLYSSASHRLVAIHTLITEVFLGKCPEGYQVNHIDGDKSNNSVQNLEYVTPSGNIIHSYKTGLHVPLCGEGNGKHKLTEVQVKAIKHLHDQTGMGKRKISRILGTPLGATGYVLDGGWAHV